ncbi:hypothetical protein quinque_007412 [Culex quinquefasciatus]
MADKDNNKRRTFDKVPTKICQYGADCYRKNPNHFKELSHPHLESILSESPKGKYRIPDEAVHEPRESNPPAKQPKKDDTPTAVGKVKTATPPKPAKMASSPPKTKSPATPSGAPSKGNAVADLFAERRARMAKQQQEQKKAEAPPSATPSSSSQPPKPTPQTGLSLKKVIPRNIHDYYPVVAPKGKMAAKLAAAAPYNMFFTTITDAPVTHREPLSVTFQELLDPSLGDLECSVQMNFMVDIGWLLGHYFFAGYEDRPLLILYGDESPELKTVSTKKPNVTALKVHIATPFGVHHTKMGLYGYTDGSMRVVISTANLYEDDFHNRTQGPWISPRLPALAEDADTGAGESRTGFRESLITYLNSYKFAQLAAWVSRIQRTDFREVKRTFDKVPTKICQYGADCYRKNPNHFKELSHPHLESILSESPKGKYRIPDELSMSREVVAEQLKIIAQLYPELESNPPAKQPKKDDTPTAVGKVKTATPPKPAKMASSPPKTKSPATPSGAPSKGNAVADLFAERRARMAKQQQEQKKAEAPPSATPSSSSQPPKPTPQTGLSLKKVIPRNIHDYYPVVAPKGKMAAKLAAAAPYNMFFTTITDAPVTHREPLSVTFQELLDPSLGDLECSVQMNFMVDIGWLLGHYFFAGYEDRPLSSCTAMSRPS